MYQYHHLMIVLSHEVTILESSGPQLLLFGLDEPLDAIPLGGLWQ